MPFINGRFYANPAYGRALERARRSSSGGVWSEDFPEEIPQMDAEVSHRRGAPDAASQSVRAAHRKHHGKDDYDAATTTAGITNQIYNETASLRPTRESGNGSNVDLQRGRLAMAHVIRNRAKEGMRGGLASDDLNPTEEKATRQFPSKAYGAFGASRRDPVAVYGPFRNTVREKGAGKDETTEYIKVYQ